MKNPTKTTEDRYTDDTKMPFGSYKGKRLKDIPAAYLSWCYKVQVSDKKLMIYIHRNIENLQRKYPNLTFIKYLDLDKELIEDYKLPDAVIELFSLSK